MPVNAAPFWKKMPFIRLLLPLVAGIICEHYFSLSKFSIFNLFLLPALLLFCLSFAGIWRQFKFHSLKGVLFSTLIFSFGLLLRFQNDIENDPYWFLKFSCRDDIFLATIDEYPVEKQNSFRATVNLEMIFPKSKAEFVSGKIILYLQKSDSIQKILCPGKTIIFKKFPREISNSGNPGSFDYKQYCRFQGITHQLYLRNGEYTLSNAHVKFNFNHWCLSSRMKILRIIQRYIPHEKEKAVAEALLLGYRQELDKGLVQSYANTGVVHIIAISGMHLALIYGLLLLALKPLLRRNSTKWFASILIVLILWLFSFLAGGGASIIRSAVMFSFIIIAELLTKRNQTFNSIIGSAFLLLCSNPFFLWDAGFQLSYGAVLSIVIFYSPVYRIFSFKRWIFDSFWKLNAVTIAAQILTFPLTIFLFHQFPNYFLLANLVAVPLSGFIIYGEIALYFFALLPGLDHFLGLIVQFMIWVMNAYVKWVDALPYSVSTGLRITLVETFLLYTTIAGIRFWLKKKNKNFLFVAIISLILSASLRTIEIQSYSVQKKIVVYNLPHQFVLEFIAGNKCQTISDSSSRFNSSENIALLASRIANRTVPDTQSLNWSSGPFHYFLGKKLLIIGNKFEYQKMTSYPGVDIIVLSGNSKISIKDLALNFKCKLFIAASNSPSWKITQWKNECDSLLLRFHSVPDEGAFILEF